MFYDLNVGFEPTEETVEELSRLGYDTIAFNQVVEAKPATWTSGRRWDPPSEKLQLGRPKPQLASRLTIKIEEQSDIQVLSHPTLKTYDLVAVQLGNEKLLQHCLQADVDIVALDVGTRSPFHVKRPHINVAREKGISFEACYGPMLRGTVPRRLAVTNIASLLRTTGGQNTILSSGASNPFELRRPLDVCNMVICSFDLDQNVARDCVSANGRGCYLRGRTRRESHKGVVRVQVDR
eukprot:Plantae.Rhodophyta-Rhodochaete_pulchella.ctg57326.p1 GENE.Plantae.Rhodophyta-Rhodochaete_pulchella.ctg57326~~Plantae.Rhodophyta-Rhodochaete_pulchella.ctg57326.p1  ORF type:complete len:244 (-),score=24.60 Plantae.Rhodophyta-Rhodochaete_pulchella.ctg57326:45-755(-)